MRTLLLTLALGTALLTSGCIVVPVHGGGGGHYYHCGYYHCR